VISLIAEHLPAFLDFSPGPVEEIRVFFAPGRVNLMGEHTDYNGGYVLPAALALGTYLFVRPQPGSRVRFASSSFSKVVDGQLDSLQYQSEQDFANYPLGMLSELQNKGYELSKGAAGDYYFVGNLPHGAGLSSSASVEVVTGYAASRLLNALIDKADIAVMAQAAENHFVGVNCGIMDQFSVAMGKAHHALSLQCDTLEYAYVPIALEGVTLVLANTNKPHSLVESKYNERRSECDRALEDLHRAGLTYPNLAAISVEEFAQVVQCFSSEVVRRRARHVVFENHRAKHAPRLLEQGDAATFGQWMHDSHVSLRDDYEVTGEELDALAQAAWSVPGCLGSRMTGAGFGGSTVSLVRTDCVSDFMETVGRVYRERIGYDASFYQTDIGDGVRELTKEAWLS
jgi:galactokinase